MPDLTASFTLQRQRTVKHPTPSPAVVWDTLVTTIKQIKIARALSSITQTSSNCLIKWPQHHLQRKKKQLINHRSWCGTSQSKKVRHKPWEREEMGQEGEATWFKETSWTTATKLALWKTMLHSNNQCDPKNLALNWTNEAIEECPRLTNTQGRKQPKMCKQWRLQSWKTRPQRDINT